MGRTGLHNEGLVGWENAIQGTSCDCLCTPRSEWYFVSAVVLLPKPIIAWKRQWVTIYKEHDLGHRHPNKFSQRSSEACSFKWHRFRASWDWELRWFNKGITFDTDSFYIAFPSVVHHIGAKGFDSEAVSQGKRGISSYQSKFCSKK